ncbi:uncharacterized protein LOC123529295 [Mercenaria mercenaria]|uniref:uncharacterized protein LOC123529295 n=1 Tax=Mercenaria mercenaria TaxID=6596 RepID=UPI00234F498C|nr:uncharacterized protein LOC123529295 [Mercenaria mercenaria]
MKIMYVACGILFIIDGVYSMYITEDKEIQNKPCSIIPANTSLPCREFTITGRPQYCTENTLQKLFPDLYNRVDPDGANWPGKIQNVEYKESSTEWTVTQDGNINYLKGFQIIQNGKDFETFGLKLCSVIDLSKMTKSDLNHLMRTKFRIENQDAGSYDVQIKPLPFPPEGIQSTGVTVSLEANKTLNVYHPEINMTVDYFQDNATAVNISVFISGEIRGLTSMEIMLFNENRDYLPNAQKHFNISQESFVINDLQEGNYTLKLTPIDPSYGSDDTTCLCYFGTSDHRDCRPCMGYTKAIRVEKWTDTSIEVKLPPTDEESMVALILAPVLVISLVVIIALSIWYIWYKNKLPSCVNLPEILRKKHSSDFTSIAEDQIAKRPTLRIIYTYDHASHKSAVNSLESLIKNSTNFIVATNDHVETGTRSSLLSSANSEESLDRKILNSADVICVVHSEWANKLISVIASGEVSAAELAHIEDKVFLAYVNEMIQNPALASKFVSIRYEYTPDSAVIREPFLGPLFNLPTNTEAFIKHLHSRAVSSDSNVVNLNAADKMALFSSINASFVYQSKHKSWLFKKLFYLRNSPSSDDSGIVMRRTRALRSRSVRSRSAETITYLACTCDKNSRQTVCTTCYQRHASRLRTYSCDLSFYPPESIFDGTSERLSLLQNKFVDINSRYHQTLNLKSNDEEEEDCFTLDGQSV